MKARYKTPKIICVLLLSMTTVVGSTIGKTVEPTSTRTVTASFPSYLGEVPSTFINIVHINDVYDVRQSPRCLLKVNKMRDQNSLTIFSGDFMGPSIISDIMFGRQMHPVIAAFDFTWSVIGNHEFDFDVSNFLEVDQLIKGGWSWTNSLTHKTTDYKTNNKWLLCNFFYKKREDAPGKAEIPGNAQKWAFKMVNGLKVCSFGLVDQAWLDASKLDHSLFVYQNYLESARKWSKLLRTTYNCDLIYVISHMENKSDEAVLADKGDPEKGIEPNDVDFVFGGHDHLYYIKKIGEKVLLKSGMDFEQFSNVKMWFGDKMEKEITLGTNQDIFGYTFDEEKNIKDTEFLFSLHRPNSKQPKKYLNILITRINVVFADAKHPDLSDYIKATIDPKIRHYLLPVMHIQDKLDSREKLMLGGESAVLNLFADVGRAYYGGEVAIVNVRMLKGEKVFVGNTFLRRLDFMRLFPYHSDKYIEVEITGAEIIELLREAVKLIHKENKRWVGTSGITFGYIFPFTMFVGAGNAVLEEKSVRINGHEVDNQRIYRAVIISSMLNEKVGFKGTIGKKVLTKEADQIEPISLFDYIGALFKENTKTMEQEFEDFKKSPCKEKNLDSISPVKSRSLDTHLDSFSKITQVGGCDDFLPNATPEILRRMRLYTLVDKLERPDGRTVVSMTPKGRGRMAVSAGMAAHKKLIV